MLFLASGMQVAAAQTVAPATASSATTLTTINGNAGKIAANTLGDVFYISQTDNIAYWLPRGTTTPVKVVTGLSGGRNVYVDSKNNLYVLNTYSGNIIDVPFVNGTYATGIAAGGLSACTSFAPTAPCNQGSAGANLSYYYQPLDVSIDAAGNLYAIDAYPNGNCTAGDCIVKFTRGTTTYNAPTVVVNTITGVDYNAQMNAAPNGDVYFANGKALYYIASGTTSAQTIGTFTAPSGVTTDASGNVYVTNDASPNTIYEIPAVSGAAQLTKAFALISTYSANSVGLDGLGDVFYTGYSGGTNLNVATLNSANIGSANVGTIASATPTSIMFTFAATTTPAGIYATGSGFTYTPGSCTAGSTYAAGSSCTVNATYTPTAVGVQRGAISLTTAAGTSISTALLSGTGIGAAETNDPGTLTAIGSGFSSPQGVRVDGSGNVFVADAGQNAVLRYTGGTGTPVSIGTGLSKPTSLALDGAGNVFIADAGNGRVVEVPNINGTLTNSAQTVIASGLGTTLSVAIDRFGSLYIADGSKTTITRLNSLGGTPSTAASSTVGSGFTMPFAISVDSTGNVFVADYSANTVNEIARYGLAQTQVGTGLSKPTGVALDAAGSIYIADSGNARLLKIPLENGGFNTNDQYNVGSTVAVPYAVAIDPSGNLYVTDITKLTVSEINRVAGTLSLGRAQINTTTSASNAYIGNSGTAALTLGTPPYTAVTTTPTYFTVTSPATNGCKAGTVVAAGFDCILSATFSPTTTGSFSDLLTFSSNAANGTPQTLTITGRGLNLAASAITLVQTAPVGTAGFGSPVTIQATITSTVAGTPTGTVTFAVDGNQLTNPPAVVNGIASVILQNLTGGSHVITATYSGDDNYAPSNNSLTVTIAKAPSTTSVIIPVIPAANPVSATPGQSVTFTATVVPSASTTPTGGVTFSVGSLILNTTPIPLTAGTNSASIMTTNLPIGNDTVTATYSGDVNYAGSSSTVSILVSYQTFTITPTAATITVSAGQTGQTQLVTTSISGFAASGAYLGLTCAGLPANSSCAFNPNNFYFVQGTPQPITLQIVTGQTPVISQPVTGARKAGLLLGMLALSPLLLIGRRRLVGKLRAAGTISLVLLLAFSTQVLTGCGSQLFGVTPKGTYQVTVTATASVNPYTGGTTYASGCSTATITPPYSSAQLELTCAETSVVTLVVQ